MSKDIIKYSLKKILNGKTVLFINLYLLFGGFVFANENSGQGYIYIFSETITNQNYFLIFLFPPLILLIMRLFNFFYANSFLVLRSENKRNLGNYLLLSSFFIVVYYFIVTLLCIGIVTNIIEHSEIIGNHLGYYATDEKVLILYVCKYFFNLLLVVLVTLLLILKLRNAKIVLCIMIFIIIYINLGSSVIFGQSILNISNYVNQLGFTMSLSKDAIESFIFYIFAHSSLIVLFYHISKNIKYISGIDDV